MSAKNKLESVSDEFLTNTTILYEDCVDGLKSLDRIVVDVTSNLTSMTRSYLVPIVYAYWERFFKSVFSEFFRCIEKAKIDLTDIDPDIISLRLRKELKKIANEQKISELHILADKFEISDLRCKINTFSSSLTQPLSFPQDIDWVETESNVSFNVLKKMCDRWKINISSIKRDLKEKNMDIFPLLKELLDIRNAVTHGENFRDVGPEDWDRLKTFVKELMSVLQLALYAHLKEHHTVLKQL